MSPQVCPQCHPKALPSVTWGPPQCHPRSVLNVTPGPSQCHPESLPNVTPGPTPVLPQVPPQCYPESLPSVTPSPSPVLSRVPPQCYPKSIPSVTPSPSPVLPWVRPPLYPRSITVRMAANADLPVKRWVAVLPPGAFARRGQPPRQGVVLCTQCYRVRITGRSPTFLRTPRGRLWWWLRPLPRACSPCQARSPSLEARLRGCVPPTPGSLGTSLRCRRSHPRKQRPCPPKDAGKRLCV